MDFEIINTPLRFQLYGKSGSVEKNCYGEVGFRLMNQMWKVVQESGIETTGINHWVYLPDDRMFVGVEVTKQHPVASEQLEAGEFELRRYLRHVHVGPYQLLPKKWAALKSALAARGETITSPSLEVYGHACADESQAETTILIALE